MEQQKIRRRKTEKKVFVSVLIVLCILSAGFGIYVSDYYHSGLYAENILETDTDLKTEKEWIYLSAETGKGTDPESGDCEIGFIFYPGAKVEYTAYLPLMERMKERGINGFLVEMPFNLAFFGSNRADEVMEEHPEIEKWYIGGHSLGGAFASAYAAKHQDEIAGLILLGAYVYGDYPVEEAVTIYGSEDCVLKRDKISYTENVHIIDGGNHAQFGDYGEQKGDGAADISEEEQLDETAELISEFIDK